jgi:hypothetical protein
MNKMTTDSNRRPGDTKPARGARRRAAAAITVLALALMCLPAFAADLELLTPLPGKSRLANMEIEIWPEYDRPAVLVFLKGEVASGVGQSISLRLPATSGGPSAVAQTSTAGGDLLNLPYDRIDAKDFITLRIQPPGRFFHVEFYDKLDTANAKREYRYSWPGDLTVDHLSVHVQQPSSSGNFTITPKFTDSAPGSDTLIYWTKDMGAAPAGKALPITIRYTKSEARTSKELLGATSSTVAGAPATSAAISDSRPVSDSDSAMPGSVDPLVYLIPAVILALLAAVAAVFLWRRRRALHGAAGGAGFCTKCGNPLRGEDRFCSKCGTAVKQ